MRDLFPAGAFRFQMGLRPGSPENFFAPTSEHTMLLAERRAWIQSMPDVHLQSTPEAEPPLEEVIELALRWGTIPLEDFAWNRSTNLRFLAENWEPDFLLLAPLKEKFVLTAGAVCFPSFWDLREKMGHSVSDIHGVVPGLNESLDRSISQFLQKLPAGSSSLRANWGLCGTSELNCHPSLRRSRISKAGSLEHTFIRAERQIFYKLPKTGGVLFGIRIEVRRLLEAVADPLIRKGLLDALQTMPSELAAYKGIADGREALVGLLQRMG